MSDSHRVSGPQFRADKAVEQEAVRTTIVGGRPPGSGQPVGAIPRGIELLIKKAAVDPEFRTVLLARRAEAADEIGLRLDPAEALMLAAVSHAQLEAIIDRTTVPHEHRRAFLGKAAAAMLAALGFSQAACNRAQSAGIDPEPPSSLGIEPDLPAERSAPKEEPARGANEPPAPTGIRPDVPPERIPVDGGVRSRE